MKDDPPSKKPNKLNKKSKNKIIFFWWEFEFPFFGINLKNFFKIYLTKIIAKTLLRMKHF